MPFHLQGTPRFLSRRLSGRTSTSVREFSPLDDAESFIWVIIWIVESIAMAVTKEKTQFPSTLDGLLAYKMAIFDCAKLTQGPLKFIAKTMMKSVKQKMAENQQLTLRLVRQEVSKMHDHAAKSRNPFL